MGFTPLASSGGSLHIKSVTIFRNFSPPHITGGIFVVAKISTHPEVLNRPRKWAIAIYQHFSDFDVDGQKY
jgi:hypothetical protein